MSKTFTINGTDRTSIIRRDSWTIVEAAYGGEVGVSGFDLDDDAGSLDVPAMKAVTITESAASPTRMYTGYTNQRGKGRGELGKVGDRRQWDVELLDLNTILDDQALVTDGANRPAETDYERVTWLLSTTPMTNLSVTAGVVPNTNTVNMEATDYRFTTGGIRRVLDDCAESAGKNYFLYNYGSGHLLYYDKQTGTSLSSSARLTTLLGDVDSTAEGGVGATQTWAIEEPVPRDDPTRIYSKVILKYANGFVTVSDSGTASTYRTREIVVVDESITTEAQATATAQQYLDAGASEETTFNCAVTLPAANVNDIRAGQRVQIKATHLDIDSYTYYRVTRRTVAGAPGQNGGTSDVLYRVGLEFAPDIKMTRFGAARTETPTSVCTDCSRKVAILPSGMDDNLSLAPGRGNMFVYDGTLLAKYDCTLHGSGSVTPNSAALEVIYHEPVYEALLAGDRAFYTGTVGTFGNDRWSNAVTVHAAETMDNRKAWTVETASDPWVVSLAAGAPTLRADGTSIEYVSNGVGNDIASMYHAGPGPWGDGTDDFDLYISGITFSAAHNNVQFLWFVGSNDERDVALVFSAGVWELQVQGTATSNSSFPVLAAATDYTIRWQHHPSANLSRAKIWATAGAEPGTWDVSRDPSADAAASDDRFYQYFDNTTAAVTSHVGNLQFDGTTYDDFNRTTTSPDVGAPSGGSATTGVLQRRDMTDGSLEASEFIRYATFDVRATPNSQHLIGILWDTDDGPFQRYSRTPSTEGSEFNITGWATDLADWNIDDAYNIYKITTTGVLYRYDASGTELWSVDLNSDYSYQWPTRIAIPSAYGTGQTILADTATGKIYVAGYIGGANWQSGGSEGVILTLDRSDGSLIADRRLTTTGGNAGAMVIALCFMNTCLWAAGAADGTDFEGETISGVEGWIAKMPI